MIYEENFLVETVDRARTGGAKVQRADRRHNEVIIMLMLMMMIMMKVVVMKMAIVTLI